jgi:hypothetical protein
VLADASADEVAVLSPEVQHEDGVVFGLHLGLRNLLEFGE